MRIAPLSAAILVNATIELLLRPLDWLGFGPPAPTERNTVVELIARLVVPPSSYLRVSLRRGSERIVWLRVKIALSASAADTTRR